MGWQWRQLDYMQTICTSLETDNHASTSSLSYLSARCSSWRPTKGVKTLQATNHTENYIQIFSPNKAAVYWPSSSLVKNCSNKIIVRCCWLHCITVASCSSAYAAVDTAESITIMSAAAAALSRMLMEPQRTSLSTGNECISDCRFTRRVHGLHYTTHKQHVNSQKSLTQLLLAVTCFSFPMLLPSYQQTTTHWTSPFLIHQLSPEAKHAVPFMLAHCLKVLRVQLSDMASTANYECSKVHKRQTLV